MKKIYLSLFFITSFFSISNIISARVVDVSQSSFQDLNINNQQCDEIRYSNFYSGTYFTLVDRFINDSRKNIFLWNWKESRTGNFLLYNLTNTSHGGGEKSLFVFNRSILSPTFLVTPGQNIRHLSTAEEYGSWSGETSSFDSGLWTRVVPFIDKDGKNFSNANIRNDGRHPVTPTFYPNFDDEVRVATFFDNDNNLNTQTDNQVVNECQRFNIRWCGDGILDTANGEQCDEGVKNGSGSTCSSTCQSMPFSCVSLTATPNSSTTGNLTSNMTCTATGTNIYSINCGNGQTINSSTGACTYSSNGTFKAICTVGGTITSTGTTSTGTTSTGVTSTGSIIGGVTSPGCTLNINVSTPGGSTGGSSGGPTGGIGAVGGALNFCGDFIVQRPNSAGRYETCDFGSPTVYNSVLRSYGKNGQPGYSCDIDCQMIRTIPQEKRPGKFIKTNPGENPSLLNLFDYRAIVGNGVNIFTKDDKIVFDGYDIDGVLHNLYLGGMTVKLSNNSDLISGSSESHTLPAGTCVGTVVYDGVPRICPDKVTLFDWEILKNFLGETRSIEAGDSFKDTPNYNTPGMIFPSQFPSTLNPTTFYVSLQFLEDPISIRVAKPAISNTSGGSAFVYEPAGYNLDIINSGNFISSLSKGNFVSSAINSGSLDDNQQLGGLYKSNNPDFINSINQSYTNQKYNISKTTLNSSSNSFNINSQLELDSFLINKLFNLAQGNDVKLIGADNDFTIESSSELKLKGKKTVIIEKGDLVIKNDLIYADKDSSWAFIVKDGDIRISKNVKKIAGVFLTLKGSIKSENGSTPDQLKVDGGLYGNSEDLVSNRTYIRATKGYHSISTGIIINYSSRSFKNPPPLLSNFIKQFSLTRIAK